MPCDRNGCVFALGRSRNRETNKYRFSSTKDSEYITLGPQNIQVRLTSSTEHSVSLTSCLLVGEFISVLVCCFVFFWLDLCASSSEMDSTSPSKAGMLRSDRTLTEKMFLAGVVPVLCCTARRPSGEPERRRSAGERGVS